MKTLLIMALLLLMLAGCGEAAPTQTPVIIVVTATAEPTTEVPTPMGINPTHPPTQAPTTSTVPPTSTTEPIPAEPTVTRRPIRTPKPTPNVPPTPTVDPSLCSNSAYNWYYGTYDEILSPLLDLWLTMPTSNDVPDPNDATVKAWEAVVIKAEGWSLPPGYDKAQAEWGEAVTRWRKILSIEFHRSREIVWNQAQDHYKRAQAHFRTLYSKCPKS